MKFNGYFQHKTEEHEIQTIYAVRNWSTDNFGVRRRFR